MAWARVGIDNRVESFAFQNDPIEGFTEQFDNVDFVHNTVSYQTSDFIVENGKARFDPLPESVAAIARSNMMEHAPEHMESTDDALCELYEQTIAQQETIDDQDAAICALYEMIGA